MKILVCGSRDWSDLSRLRSVLDEIHAEAEVTELVHGAARGADRMAAYWARRAHPRPIVHAIPADWANDGRAAGPIRNRRMLLEHPDVELVVAFFADPRSRGTSDMVGLARSEGIAVRRVDIGDATT